MLSRLMVLHGFGSNSGSTNVLGYTGLPCTLTFDVQDNETVGTLVGTFAKTRTITLPLITWIRFFVRMGIGLAIYFSYGRFHSHVDATASAAAAD